MYYYFNNLALTMPLPETERFKIQGERGPSEDFKILSSVCYNISTLLIHGNMFLDLYILKYNPNWMATL